MATEDRVMAKLANSNPVPDIETIDLVRAGSAGYLAALERRRSEVTNPETRPAQVRARRRNVVPRLAAAAAVVVLGTIIYLTTQWSEETTVGTSPISASARTIEHFLTTDNYNSLVELVSDDWLADRAPAGMNGIDNAELAVRWADYWAAEEIMGVERSIDFDSCDGTAETLVTCTVTYTSDVTRALGDPYVERSTFKLVDNKITVGDLPAPTMLFVEFAAYARSSGLREEFDNLCSERHPDNLRLPNHRRPGPDCASFIVENLDSWTQREATG